MIEFKAGDLFAEDVEALVNAVNCVGVMGRGVALQFKRRSQRITKPMRCAAGATRSG